MNFNFIRPFLTAAATQTESTMRFEINRPWLFFIIIPALALALIPFFRLHKSRRYNIKHVVPLILHVVILFLAVLLITGIKIIEISPAPTKTEVIVVADVSESNSAMKDDMNEYIKNLYANADDETTIGVVVFANDAIYYNELGDSPLEDFLSLEGENLKTGSTNIGDALKYTVSLFTDTDRINKRVLLMSDGRQTIGNAWDGAEYLASNGIRLDGAYFDVTATEGYSEIQMLSLKTTVIKDKVANVSVDFAIKSTSATAGKVTFYEIPQDSTNMSEATAVFSSKLNIKKGNNAYNFKYMSDGAGIHSVYAVVEAEEGSDSISQNNTLYSWFEIDGKPNILVVDGDGTQVSGKITSLIEKEECDYDVIETTAFPTKMADLLPYDEIILMNVNFGEMPLGAPNLIKRYVEEVGRGLIFTCGSNSYDYNNQYYANNPLVDILPVDLKIDETRETIATVITVDLSSSMGAHVPGGELSKETGLPMTRYDMVKESVIAVLEDKAFAEFPETNYIGVIIFNSEAKEIIPLTPLTEKDWLVEQINYHFESEFYYHTNEKEPSVSNRVKGSGTQDKNGFSVKSYGTAYLNAISKSSEMLSNSDADLKQLVFLSDGEPSDKGQGYAGTIGRMASTGTTTSTILIGNDNQNMVDELSNLATIGHGKFTQVFSSLDLSESLVKIAESKKGDPINERDTQLELRNDSAITVGLSSNQFDIIGGYYGTTAKEQAKIILSADDLRPIIAEWKIGLGHATVYMSDLGGKWSQSLFEYDKNDPDDADNIVIVQNLLVNSINKDIGSSGLKVTSKREGEETTVTVETEKKIRKATEKLIVHVTDMAGNKVSYEDEETFKHLSGGTRNIATVATADTTATYHIHVQLVDKESLAVYDEAEYAVVGFYEDEYDLFNINGKSIIEDVVASGDGKMVKNETEFLSIKKEGLVQYIHNYSTLVLALLLILFILDLLFRHFSPKKKTDKKIMTDEEQYESMRGR